MKDPKNIKEGVEKCLISDTICRGVCPYSGDYPNKCCGQLGKDTLEYIESLEERVAIMSEDVVYCRECKSYTSHGEFCGICGRWGEWTDPDTYCSHGERKEENE